MGELLLQGLVALLSFGGTWALTKLGKYLSAKADEYAQRTKLGFLSNVDDILMGYVTELYEVETKALKEAATDGKLSPEERARLKGLAINKTKEYFTVEKLALLFGSSNINTALSARTEKALTEVKASEAWTKK